MIFDLPETGIEQPPAFTNATHCSDWLKTIPLANAMQAQAIFLRQLTLLARFTMSINDRFAVLETLRGPIRQAQDAMAKKFIGRPLPFSPSEQAALDSTLAIWQSLLTNYLHCFEEGDIVSGATTAPAEPSKKNAIAIERALATLADWQIDLIQGKRLPDVGYWRKLHRTFFLAESTGIADQMVHDALRYGKQTVTPLAVYSECHLLYIISPYELTSRDLSWAIRWTRRWGNKIKLLTAPPEDIQHCAHPLWIDLDSDQPADHMPRQTLHGQSRWLETTELRTSLTSRLTLLGQGQAPTDLQLGADVTQPGAGKLMIRLLHRWCQGGSARKHVRQSVMGHCDCIVGFDAVHFHLSGQRTFHALPQDDAALRLEQEKFAIFGDTSHRLDVVKPAPDTSYIENWAVMDDWNLLDTSATGLRISRPLKEGGRIAVGSLIATRTEQTSTFVIGCVRWTLRQDANSLAVGIQLFPGEVQAIMARPLDTQNAANRPAFFIEASKEGPACLVLPIGSFQIGRRIQILRASAEVVTLTSLLAYGNEFECCSFTP
jgi:hypothetical protein